MSNILSFLPDQFLPFVIVIVAFGIMLGLLRIRTGLGIIAGFVGSIVLAPFVGQIFDWFPWWLNLLILAFTGISLVQAFAAVFIGERASDTMAGSLAGDMVRFTVRALLFPFRIAATGILAIFRSLTLRRF